MKNTELFISVDGLPSKLAFASPRADSDKGLNWDQAKAYILVLEFLHQTMVGYLVVNQDKATISASEQSIRIRTP